MTTAALNSPIAPRIVGRAKASASSFSPSDLSFPAVYREHFDFVWSCVRRCGVSLDATEDVVQDIFIVIHAKLHSVDKPEALRSWIYGVARRVVSNHRRALRTQAAAGILTGSYTEAAVSPAPNPFEQAKTNADLIVLASLLNELDEPKREVFALVELDEVTVPEAAGILEIPLNTAYSRLRAARHAFGAAVVRRRQHGAAERD